MSGWTIRPIEPGDLAAVAELHKLSFPQSLLGRLGTDVLSRYYASSLAGPGVEGLVATRSDRIIGFLVGGRFAGEVTAFVHDNRFLLARRALTRPLTILRIGSARIVRIGFSLLVRPVRSEAEVPERVPPDSFGVLAVAVEPGERRQGVGRGLLGAAGQRARDLGCQRMHLTLNPQDRVAMQFYDRLGWRRHGARGDTSSAWLMSVELEL